MYGEYSAVIIYGFREGNLEWMIDDEWFRENFPDLNIYYSTTKDGVTQEAIYGISLEMDVKTGKVSVTAAEKKKVEKLFKKFQAMRNPKKGKKRSATKEAASSRKKMAKKEEKTNETKSDDAENDEDDENEEDDGNDEEEEEPHLGYYLGVYCYDADDKHAKYSINSKNQREMTKAAPAPKSSSNFGQRDMQMMLPFLRFGRPF